MDLKEELDHPEHQEHLDLKDPREAMVLMDPLDLMDLLDHQDPLETGKYFGIPYKHWKIRAICGFNFGIKILRKLLFSFYFFVKKHYAIVLHLTGVLTIGIPSKIIKFDFENN